MPNWAYGNIEVTGKIEYIEKFLERFIFIEEQNADLTKENFFYRSFINSHKADFMQDFEIETDEQDETSFSFQANFAWSAFSCIMEERSPSCVLLTKACKEDNVSVDITTEEEGMIFEEFITCNSNGTSTYRCVDMPIIVCKDCGSTRPLPSYTNINDAECYECSSYNMEYKKEQVNENL